MAAFERMEEKVLMQQAHVQAAADLTGINLENQFEALISCSDINDELEVLKTQMTLGFTTPSNQLQMTSSEQSSTSTLNQVVDEELEALRKQLDKM